jgi:4a-hydroxytetrahydrobiopterin dehydratase
MARDQVLSDDEVGQRLAAHADWSVVDGRLHREAELADFAAAFACMTRIALAAEKMDHHPDWSNSWNRLVIDITNHAAGGLTERCFELAAAVDAAVAATA